MKIDNLRTYGWEAAFRGMRNPKDSWAKSDSFFGLAKYDEDTDLLGEVIESYEPTSDKEYDEIATWLSNNGLIAYGEHAHEYAYIGKEDLKLAQKLIRAGSEHRKFMRQIFVSMDITAPLYIWKEMDTYKVATTTNSTSTMHTLEKKPITRDSFEMDDYNGIMINNSNFIFEVETIWDELIDVLEKLRQLYLKTGDKRLWKELIRLLPESWLQTRTWTGNYENLLSICSKGQRRSHKLNEWSGVDNSDLTNFVNTMRELPYAQELIFLDECQG